MNMMLLELIYQADWMSKFVLLSLLALSIMCWALFFSMIISLSTYNRQINQALHACQSAQSLDELLALSIGLQNTIVGPVISETVKSLKDVVHRSDRLQRTLTRQEFELIQESIYTSGHDILQEQERYLPLFSTSFEVSPLIGLFGTVWGLVHSFMRISQFQSADITTVAPGISEALITTLAGLMVAIPALIMFNYGQSQIRLLENTMFKVTERIEWLIKRLFMVEGR